MWWTVVLAAVVIFLLWEASRPDPAEDSDLPGKFFYTKKWLFYVMLLLNARKQRKQRETSQRDAQTDRTKRGYGQTVLDPQLLDCCQTLETHPQAIDTTYFNGFAADGTSLALRVARKPGREGEVWVLMSIPGVGFLQHPLHPDTAVYNMAPGEFRAAGAQLQVLEPMRRWKVAYNGLLRKGPCNSLESKPEEYVHVKLNLNWECINDPFNFDTDLDKKLLAEGIAKQKWSRQFFEMLRSKHQSHYEQCGVLSGTLEVEGHSTRRLQLYSFRDHTYGVRNWELFHRYTAHFIWVPETGFMAFVIILWMPGYIKFLKSGYVVYANGVTLPVTATDLDIVAITRDRTPPQDYTFSFDAGGRHFSVEVHISTLPELYHYSGRTSRILETLATFTVNGQAARGMVEFHYRNPEGPAMEGPEPSSATLLVEPSLEKEEQHSGEITLAFQERLCQSSLLVGGKGAQLAQLTTLQQQNEFQVPRGFCLTLSAFQQQLTSNTVIDEKIEEVRKAARCNDPQLKNYCDDVVQLLASSTILQPIADKLTEAVGATFGDISHLSLAVRSSAAGEDGSEASSAGQMETFLGVQGTSQLLEAVRKCWASAYTHQAVEYRRQHGQPVRTSVGVVIQEMVKSEVSGVLFTNDPLSGNTNTIVIDASYGLGEIVVSGKATPDTITVRRHFDGRLEIEEKRVGDKKLQISVAESGGTTELPTDTTLGQQCCLTDQQILNLSQVAVQVENSLGGGRDIEWAICGDQIYLLQARPITTDDQETDEDLIHEFDSPVITGQEWLTIGNIGEMMPGCVTPLTASVFIRTINTVTASSVLELGGGKENRYADNKCVMLNSARPFLNMTYLAWWTQNSLIGNKDALELNLLGEALPDHRLENILVYGPLKTSRLAKLWDLASLILKMRSDGKLADAWIETHKTFSVGLECHTAEQLYREIDRLLPVYHKVWEVSLIKSHQSGQANAFMMGIVSGGKSEWTLDNYSDVCQLLAQCQNVYSAEVPSAIQDMAKCIENLGVAEKVQNMSDKECVCYFTSADCDPELQKHYSQFLDRHGHRCIREAEFIEKSWRAEPEKFIKILKSVLSSKAYSLAAPEPPNIKAVIQNLKSPVSAVGKFLLRRIVPRARQGVQSRELGKSVAVQGSDQFKDAYWRLADLMVAEERLPEAELMFFLTHAEIGQLLSTRSAKLIAKAVRRRRILPLQMKTEFPRFSVGIPQPIHEEVQGVGGAVPAFTVKGTPVCRGSVKGPARVVKSLDEASGIQKGDILIVSYTDIGWTPYFPLISGLVTEMGGLISHGAVVAREYGIPCLVNVSNATKMFNSGDSVHLEANSGTLHKLDVSIAAQQ